MLSTVDHQKIAYEIPKAELHCHIEGSIQPELIIKLAKKHNLVHLQKSIEEYEELFKFTNLKQFLELYNICVEVLQDEEDFKELMYMYLEKTKNQGMKYAEVFFDLQKLYNGGLDYVSALKGLNRGIQKAKEDFQISANIIVCFTRDMPEEKAIEAFNSIIKYKEYFVGIGLASNEYGYPPENFKNLFDLARDHGLRLVCHAGEEDKIPTEYIYSAIEVLKVERIDHGIQIYKDEKLIDFCAKSKITLTTCPISNYKLQVFNELSDAPIRKFLDKGLAVTINSDDPGFFNCFIGETYEKTGIAFNFTLEDYKTVAINSFKGSFLSDEEKQYYISLVNKYQP